MDWIPAIVIFIYLAVVLYIGVFAFRRGKETGEDFFLASRSIGTLFFFLSLFATNMTAFAILGSSGMSYRIGIGVFAMMATSSCLVIPLTLLYIGTRLWVVGKRFGHMTQVAYFRDRWECSEIGTLIFLVTAAMLLPYLIISIDGGGTILSALTNGKISYPIGGAVVALIVMATVFFGGMRGAVWVNALQTILFVSFGLIAFAWIGGHLPGGFRGAVEKMLNDPSNKLAPTPMGKMGTLLTRERIPWQVFLSFMLIPLSSIMFPHMSIMCFTARKVTAFKKTVVWYPICIMAIWLPCVFLGALGPGQDKVRERVATNSKGLHEWLEAGGAVKNGEQSAEVTALINALHGTVREGAAIPPGAPGPNAALATKNAAAASSLLAGVAARRVGPEEAVRRLYVIKDPKVQAAWGKMAADNSDSILLEMLKTYVHPLLAGILAAGIISAVMGSDCHQILGLSTMFTKDLFNYYGGGRRLGEKATVMMGRVFIVLANGIAYVIALGRPPIFDLAVTYAFAGFAAMSPVMIAALFWKRSTKWGALAGTLWVAFCVVMQLILEPHSAPGTTFLHVGATKVLFISPGEKLSFYGFSMVVPMVIGSAVCVVLFSLLTPPPSAETIERYFPRRGIAGERGVDRAMPAVAAG